MIYELYQSLELETLCAAIEKAYILFMNNSMVNDETKIPMKYTNA